MKVSNGARLGSYEIRSALGAGGMGEVWRARDTKLRRDVAIKTLPDSLAQDPNRLARLEREAELLASLSHPNIAVIHGLEDHDGTRFLVLELVEGPTLEDCLRRGPLPVKEALKLAVQIAEALEAAHEKGIVHRDLKPANVIVTTDGRVKVVDFGLAKASMAPFDAALAETAIATHPGIIAGTPAYMSPEQARGESAGPQSDIWSFGAVLYELLAGRSPFGQRTAAETLAKLLEVPPDFSALPAATPRNVQTLVRRCLERDRKQRRQHMGDVRIEIEDALAALESPQAHDETREPLKRRRGLWAGGVLVVSALAGLLGWYLAVRSISAVPAASIRLSIPFFEPPRILPVGSRHVALSPDGSRIAYASQARVLVRRMDSKDATAVIDQGSNPVFSPDGRWITVFRATDLAKVPVDGGPPISLAGTSARPAGAAWGADGTIVFATTEGLFQVSQSGGEPRLLARPDRDRKERLYAWPHFLPGGRSLLVTVVLDGTANECQIALVDLKTLQRKTVIERGSAAQFALTGHLVYAAGQTMKTVAFDPAAQRVLGDPTSLGDIEVATAADNGAADFALSETGTLAFLSPSSSTTRRTLQWIDHRGQRQPIGLEPGPYGYPRVSPDGSRVALDINRRGNRDIWILTLDRLNLTRLTDGPTEDVLPVWSRDGHRVFFASDRTGNFDVYSQAADGASAPRVEFAGPGLQMTQSMTPDGNQLLVSEDFTDTSVLDLKSPGRLVPLLNLDAAQVIAAVSPDGHWVAYESDEAGGQFEIFVRPFPRVSERREKISLDGGRFPLWGPAASRELYYVNLKGEMMAASITLSPALVLGPVTKLFDFQKPPAERSGIPYDVSPDGRFLATPLAPADTQAPTQVSVVLNWSPPPARR